MSDRWHLHPSGYWQTPIGVAVIDDELTGAISAECDLVTVNAQIYDEATQRGGSLPFLQYLFDEIRLVPVMTPSSGSVKGTEMGLAMARAAKKAGRDTVIIASSSASMYYAFPETRASDRRLIDHITRFDAQGFVGEAEDKAWNGVAALEATIVFTKRRWALFNARYCISGAAT